MRRTAKALAVASALGLLAPAAEARRDGDEGAVVGTVFVDSAARDGVYTAGEDQALAGYRVELLATGGAGAAVAETISDGQGRFAFTAVPAGRYRLRASSPSRVELAETGAATVVSP